MPARARAALRVPYLAFGLCGARMLSSLSAGSAADVVLVSGGVESSALLAGVCARGGGVLPVFLSYAQRAAGAERLAAELQVARAAAAGRAAVDPLLVLPLDGVGAAVRALRPHSRMHVPLPHRNLPLLALAVSVCAARRAHLPRGAPSALYIALSNDDTSWYPSASRDFLQQCRDMARTLEPGLRIEAPFIDMHKHEIVRDGTRAGVDWATTYSCMLGPGTRAPAAVHAAEDTPAAPALESLVHCGRCSQCVARKQAFHKAGIPDGSHGTYLR